MDKLLINCGQSCGKVDSKALLWKTVDKFCSYPQKYACYPQFVPQAFLSPRLGLERLSTVSTGPTIIIILINFLLCSQNI